MKNEFIKHDGINGMKWGVRRYQNEDGTWTPAGLERRREQYRSTNRQSLGRRIARGINAVVTTGGAAAGAAATTASVAKNPSSRDVAFKPGKDGKPSLFEKSFKESGNIIGSGQKIDDILARGKNEQTYADINDLSNDELNKMLTRMDLERRYTNAINSQDSGKGKEFVRDALEITGQVAAIGVSAAMIYTAIRNIKKGS